MRITRPSKKRYKERIIRITEDLKEECVTEEYFRYKRLASYAQHRGHCRKFLQIDGECNCGFDTALLTTEEQDGG